MSNPSPPSNENLSLEARRRFYDALAEEGRKPNALASYYRRELVGYHRHWIPKGASVLEIGCGKGNLLAAVEPARGVGIDFSGRVVEQAREAHPNLDFRVLEAEDLGFEETFDYVIVSNLLGDLIDVQKTFEGIHRVCGPDTRILITFYNQIWEPVLKLAERVGLKVPNALQNWLSQPDLENLLELTDYDIIKGGYKIPIPLYVPLVTPFLNRTLSVIPLLRQLGLVTYMIARPKPKATRAETKPSVTVLIPCRNEKGNVESAVLRTPQMGSHTEILFVDGNSTDGTPEEIERVMGADVGKDRDIRLLHQGAGVGKGDAVRKGFAAAKCDILMILDADLTVPPEDLPKFYEALVKGKGEFINGTRLVYPMEKQAMRFLNYLGNRFFSAAFSWILEQRFRDTLCGTKVLTKANYDRIAAGRNYFGDFDPFGDFDLIFGAAKLNLKIIEVPIRYRERTYGTTNISRFRHGLLLLRMLPIAFRKLKWL